MKEKLKKIQPLRFLLAVILLGVVVTVSVSTAKYVINLGEVGSFTLSVQPSGTLPTASEFKTNIANSKPSGSTLQTVVFGRWDRESGYNAHGAALSASDWETGVNVDSFGAIKVFYKEEDSGKYTAYVLSEEDIVAPSDSSYLFAGKGNPNSSSEPYGTFSKVEQFIFDNFHLPSSFNGNYMFNNCTALKTLDLSFMGEFNDSTKTISLHGAFNSCAALESLSLAGINFTRNSNIFNNTTFSRLDSLETLDISGTTWWYGNIEYLYYAKSPRIVYMNGINTEQVTETQDVFNDWQNLETIVGLEDFDVDNLTHMGEMFKNCKKLDDIHFQEFAEVLQQGNKVSELLNAFANCEKMSAESASMLLAAFNAGSVTTMDGMFSGCTGISGSIDMSSFNESRVTNMSNLFYGCSKLTTIYVDSAWSTTSVMSSTGMFTGCTKLVGGNGTEYSSSYTDKTYACIDKPGQLGYFTQKINRMVNSEMTLSTSLTTKAEFDDYYTDLLVTLSDDVRNQMMAEIEALGLGEKPEPSEMNSLYEIYCKYYGWFIADALPGEKLPPPAGYYMDYYNYWVHNVVFITASSFKNVDTYEVLINVPIDDYGGGSVRLIVDEGLWGGITPSTMYFVVDDGSFGKIIPPADLSDFFAGFVELEEVYFNGLLDVSGVTNFTGMFSGCNSLTTVDVTGLDLTAEQLNQMLTGCESTSLTITGGPDGYALAADESVAVSVDLEGVTNGLVTANGDFISDMLYTEDGVLVLDVEADEGCLMPETITVTIDDVAYSVSTTEFDVEADICFEKFEWEGGTLYIRQKLLTDGSVIALTVECVDDVPEEEPGEGEEEAPQAGEGEEPAPDTPDEEGGAEGDELADEDPIEPDPNAPTDEENIDGEDPVEGDGEEPNTEDPVDDVSSEEDDVVNDDDISAGEEERKPEPDDLANDEIIESEEPAEVGNAAIPKEDDESNSDAPTDDEGGNDSIEE